MLADPSPKCLSWKKLVAESVVHPGQLPRRLAADRAVADAAARNFPMRVNPYFLSLIHSPDDPLGRQVIPSSAELAGNNLSLDPLAEELQSPVAQVIHRYPGRVVFLVSDQCAVHCRFCMRRRNVFKGRGVSSGALEEGLAYIRGQGRINEVILSGGDPLMLDDDRLDALLLKLSQIQHVRVLRIHTRVPCVLPQRITPHLVRRLTRFQPLYINIHFNHPSEISAAAEQACTLLIDAGIVLGSQTVLLKGVNDHEDVLHDLMQRLLQVRIRPYYLHQLDHVAGATHFEVPLERSLALVGSLRGRLSGLAVPHFMVDLPGGGGKVALLPDSVQSRDGGQWLIRNWQGRFFAYTEMAQAYKEK